MKGQKKKKAFGDKENNPVQIATFLILQKYFIWLYSTCQICLARILREAAFLSGFTVPAAVYKFTQQFTGFCCAN